MRLLCALLSCIVLGCRGAQPASAPPEAAVLGSARALDGHDQSTPRAALRGFVRALSDGRYDIALRFIPTSDRQGVTPESLELLFSGEGLEDLGRILGGLQEHLEDPIEVAGDRATMSYGGARSVQFLREGGVWKIEDPE